jgi:hypothetical protein
MATLSVRIDDALRDELEDMAAATGVSSSEVIRQALEVRLGRDVRSDWDAPRSLSMADRHTLALLHTILARLDSSESEYHETRAAVLQNGWTGEYENEFAAIDRELTLAECKMVWDVLDMFRVLRSSIEAVGVDAVRRIDEHAEAFLVFGGFDLNDTIEGRMLGYVRHLFASDRWSELKADMLARSDGGNSHSPRLAVYTRMLTAFTPIWNDKVQSFLSGHGRQHLDQSELAAVVEAAYHPSSRRDRTGRS